MIQRLEYNDLWELDKTSFFSRDREWSQFNALYITRHRQTLSANIAVDAPNLTQKCIICKYEFGFYTGRRDEWHSCSLIVTPYAARQGASLTVLSYNSTSNETPYVTRTFNKIYSLTQLTKIMDEKYWHSFYCFSSNGWSYIENQARSSFYVGYEE